MAYSIREVADALANLSVSYTNEAGASITPSAKDINQIPTSLAPADVPIRLIGRAKVGGNSGGGVYIATSNTVEYEYTLMEVFLLESAGLSNPKYELPDMLRYEAALSVVLTNNRSIYSNCRIENWTTERITNYVFPDGSDEQWYGVETMFTIAELP